MFFTFPPGRPLDAERQAMEFGIERSASTVAWSGFRGEYSSAFDTTAQPEPVMQGRSPGSALRWEVSSVPQRLQ